VIINNFNLGVLIPVDNDQWVQTIYDYIDTSFPVGLLFDSSITSINFSNMTLIAHFQGWDDNFYIKFASLTITFSFISVLLNFLCMSWALYKLFQMHRTRQLALNIASVCLSLEVLCCAIRTTFNLMGFIANFMSVSYDGDILLALYYFSFPFTLSSGIFLIFFWIDITSSTLYHGAFLDKAFWPSIIFVAFGFVLVYISGILLMLSINQVLINYTAGFILFFSVVVAIIYFIAAKKVYQFTLEKHGQAKAKELQKMTKKIVLSGVVIILIVVVSVSMLGLVGNTSLNLLYSILSFVLALLFVLRSFLQIEVFATPKKLIKSKATHSNNSHDLEATTTESKPITTT